MLLAGVVGQEQQKTRPGVQPVLEGLQVARGKIDSLGEVPGDLLVGAEKIHGISQDAELQQRLQGLGKPGRHILKVAAEKHGLCLFAGQKGIRVAADGLDGQVEAVGDQRRDGPGAVLRLDDGQGRGFGGLLDAGLRGGQFHGEVHQPDEAIPAFLVDAHGSHGVI